MLMMNYMRQWLSNRAGGLVLPLELILFVTGRCNFRCSHCFIEEFATKPENDLPLADIEKLARDLPDLMVLMLTGGEPFLRDDLPEIISLFGRYSRPKVISIVSNGFLTDKIIAAVERSLAVMPKSTQLVLTLSFEGAGPEHDELRGRKGSFENALATAARARQIAAKDPRFSIGANLTLVERNAATVLATAHKLRATGYFSFLSHNMFRTGKARDPFRQANLDVYKKLSAEIQRSAANFSMGRSSLIGRIHRAKEKRQAEIIAEACRTGEYQALPCEAGRQIGVIYSDGAVAPCELLAPSWGNIRRESFSAIWNRRQNRLAAKAIRDSKCFCTHECFIGASMNTRVLPTLKNLVSVISPGNE